MSIFSKLFSNRNKQKEYDTKNFSTESAIEYQHQPRNHLTEDILPMSNKNLENIPDNDTFGWEAVHYCSEYDDEIGRSWLSYNYTEHTRSTFDEIADDDSALRFEISLLETRRGEPDSNDVILDYNNEITFPQHSTIKNDKGNTLPLYRRIDHFTLNTDSGNYMKSLSQGEVSINVNIFYQDEKQPRKTIRFSASQEVLKSNLYERDSLGKEGESWERRMRTAIRNGHGVEDGNTYFYKGEYYPRKADTELWGVKSTLLKELTQAVKNPGYSNHADAEFVFTLLKKTDNEILKAPQKFQEFLQEIGVIAPEEKKEEIRKQRSNSAKEVARRDKSEANKKATDEEKQQKFDVIFNKKLKDMGIVK